VYVFLWVIAELGWLISIKLLWLYQEKHQAFKVTLLMNLVLIPKTVHCGLEFFIQNCV